MNLDKEQRKVVAHIEGPLLVIAPPGSGKTTTVVTRTISLTKEFHVEAKKILCLTFTREAANEMKNRLTSRMGQGAIAQTETFHSLGLKLIRKNPEYCFRRKGVELVSETEAFDSFHNYLLTAHNNIQKGEARDLYRTYGKLRNSGFHPLESGFDDGFRKLAGEIGNDTYITIASQIFKGYEEYKFNSNIVDFEDCIYLVVKGLSSYESFLKKTCNEFQFINVDEFQDTNHSQYELLKYLCYFHRNIMVVCDDDQSIYGWRGSKPELIKKFHSEFKAKAIGLKRNYRSNIAIVTAANNLIASNTTRYQKHVYAQDIAFSEGPQAVIANSAPHLEELLLRNIREDLEKNIDPKEIAILYRINALSFFVEDLLNSNEIPYTLLAKDQEKHSAITLFYDIISLASNDTSYEAFNRVALLFEGITNDHVSKVIKVSKAKGISLWESCDRHRVKRVSSMGDTLFLFLKEVFRQDTKKALKYLRGKNGYLFDRWLDILAARETKKGATTSSIKFEQNLILDELEVNLFTHLSHLNIDEYSEHTKFDPILDFNFHGNSIQKEVDGISVGSSHSSKGREWESVHVIGFSEKIFPSYSSKRPLNSQSESEERRLAYVTVTRARRKLRLYTSPTIRGPEYPLTGFSPSRFYEEMGIKTTNENIENALISINTQSKRLIK